MPEPDVDGDALGETVVRLRDGAPMTLGPLRAEEHDQLFDLFAEVVASGEGFPHEPPLSRRSFSDTWVEPVTLTTTARLEGGLTGAYYLKPNFIGKAAHIANAGYVVAREHRGRGIGRSLLEDSITRAPLLGFDAIQFNLVFESNPARSLYEELGWVVIGRVPEAVAGDDCFIYWRSVAVGADRIPPVT